MIEVDRRRATAAATAALRAAGISGSDAERTAAVLVSADARGKHSHGLLRLPRIVEGIERGNVDPDGEIRVRADRGAAAYLDGGARLGPVVATRAVDGACERAAAHGVGLVGVRNATHLGMLGYYTDRAREAGYVAIAMTNTEPAMPPFGGSGAVLGTNPIAIGLPTEPAFNLDMSTASISRGEVLRREEAGEPLPAGVALDADGAPTRDPAAALEGVILPFGGAKGAGLAIAVEVLAGGLVGAAMGEAVTGTYDTTRPCTKGDLFVAIDPVDADFGEATGPFLERLRRLAPAEGFDAVRLPGERSVAADRERTVVEVDEAVWDRIGEPRD